MSFGIRFGFPSKTQSSVSYNAKAQLVFDMVGDVPEVVKPFYSNLFQSFEDANVWERPNFWGILCIPSLSAHNSLLEIKSLTIVSSFGVSTTTPYNNNHAEIPSFAGWKFKNGYIKTGFIPSAKMALNDSCIVTFTYSDEIGAATFNAGALNGVGQSTVLSTKLNTNAQVADAYSTTIGAGRISQAGASGAKGYRYINRTSNVFAELVENGITVGTIVSTGGALPTIEDHLNGYNNAGVNSARREQSPIHARISLGGGIDATQKAILNSAFSNYSISMERVKGLHTKQIVMDGNSHTTYFFDKQMRTIEYNTIVTGWTYDCVGASGQNTQQRTAAYAATVAPLYNAGFTKKILIIQEGTNSMQVQGRTKDQAIADMAAYVTAAKATGWDVGVKKQFCRVAPTSGAGLTTYPTATLFNLAVSAYNDDVDAGLTGADFVIPVSANHFIHRSNYGSDALYNAAITSLLAANTLDGTHLPESGYKEEADLTTTAILLR